MKILRKQIGQPKKIKAKKGKSGEKTLEKRTTKNNQEKHRTTKNEQEKPQ